MRKVHNHIVFVNGNYSEKLSKLKDIKVVESDKIIEENNFISVLNASYLNEVIEIEISKDVDVKITHINTADKIITFPRIRIKVNGKVNLFEEFIDSNKGRYCSVSVLELHVKGELTHVRIQNQNYNQFQQKF